MVEGRVKFNLRQTRRSGTTKKELRSDTRQNEDREREKYRLLDFDF